jgi:hypothetical protein
MDANGFPYREFKDADVREFTFQLTEYIAEIVIAKQTYEQDGPAARQENELPHALLQRGRRHRVDNDANADRSQVSVKDFLSSLRGQQS